MLSCIASSRAATINTVFVGNSGNAPDDPLRYGDVAYTFRIGVTEVTNEQYAEFLNSVDPVGANELGLWYSDIAFPDVNGISLDPGSSNGSKFKVKPGRDNNPVAYVSWYSAVRFANWLNNGQGSGDTESGAYTLLGGTPTPTNGATVSRNVGARWFLPTEDEWYKAAYHKNDGVTGHYWNYPTATDEVPYSDQPPGNDAPDPTNTANFYRDDGIDNGFNDGQAVNPPRANSLQNPLSDVAAYVLARSAYGTYDQGGNLWEWNETRVNRSDRGFRGGSYAHGATYMSPSVRGGGSPSYGTLYNGFRVATFVPEPSMASLICTGGVALLLAAARVRIGSMDTFTHPSRSLRWRSSHS